MRKLLIITLAALMAILLCAPAFAVTNSNHFIEPGYKTEDEKPVGKFNADESEWDILGWTVVDTEIVRLGYVLDGAGIVWAVDDVDVRADNSVIDPNDCFYDQELNAAVASYGLANGLAEFFAYRVHVTLDTKAMEKGEHMLEVAAEYKDGSIGNPFRDTAIEFTKTKEAVIDDTDESETGPDNPSEFEVGDCNRDGAVDNKDIVVLFRYVSSGEAAEDETIYDYNGDGEVNNKDVTTLFRDVSKK